MQKRQPKGATRNDGDNDGEGDGGSDEDEDDKDIDRDGDDGASGDVGSGTTLAKRMRSGSKRADNGVPGGLAMEM